MQRMIKAKHRYIFAVMPIWPKYSSMRVRMSSIGAARARRGRILIDAGADVNAKDNNGDRALTTKQHE